MRKILLSIMLVVITISCSEAQKNEFSSEALLSEMIATDKSATTFQNVLDANKGKIVVIDVWASWCSDCIKGFPKAAALKSQFPDAAYVYVSMDRDFDSWKTGIEKHQLKGQHFWAPEGMKGTFGKAVDLSWIPRYIIVDQSGKVAYYNAITADDAKMIEKLKELQK